MRKAFQFHLAGLLLSCLPLAIALGLGLAGMLVIGTIIVGQGIYRTAHHQTFFPPEPKRAKPTGLDNAMFYMLTSPDGRNAARKHLLIQPEGEKHGQK